MATLILELRPGLSQKTLNQNNSHCNGDTKWSLETKKFKQAFSVNKIMSTIFQDKKGALFIDFL